MSDPLMIAQIEALSQCHEHDVEIRKHASGEKRYAGEFLPVRRRHQVPCAANECVVNDVHGWLLV